MEKKKNTIMFFFAMLFLFSIANSFGATQVISSCPETSVNNNTDYVLSDIFTISATPCFDMYNIHNVSIDGNNTEREFTSTFYMDIHNTSNIVLKNFNVEGYVPYFRFEEHNEDIGYYNNIIFDTQTTAPKLFQPINTNTHYINNVSIIGNHVWFTTGDKRQRGIFGGLGTNHNIYLNATIKNNDFDQMNFYADPFGTTFSRYWFDKLTLSNNNLIYLGTGNYFGNANRGVYFSNTCPSVDYTVSNNLFSVIDARDSDQDGTSDAIETYSASGCTNIVNNYVPTKKESNIYERTDYITFPYFTNLEHLHTYRVGRLLTLNSSDYFDFSNVVNSILDLSIFRNEQAIDVKNTRTIKLGSLNDLWGGDDTSKKPIIVTSGTISIPDLGYYSNNWHIIEYLGNIEINNIKFDLTATDSYGLLRKKDSATDGSKLKFYNNYFDLNFIPASPSRPFFVIGALSDFQGNQFDLPTTTNVSLIGAGVSSSIGGGHNFIDNSFYGGGFIFSKMSDIIGGTNFESKFIHNEFRQLTLYSYPFHPTDKSQNLLEEPKLNGSYYYKTLCTHYEFNVGNYYEDWDDLGRYNDSDSDGIHDSWNGTNYINRGQDYLNNSINDYRSVTPYPFDFASKTGTAQATYDVCASFNFNINVPVDNTTYTSGTDLETDFEYIATGYPNMQCFESINSETVLYLDVSSGENQGSTWELSNGQGYYQVTCCDNIQCDNIVKTSQEIEFCVGNCDDLLVVINVTEPVTPIGGCTDSSATNYNPSATYDDGSCTYADDGDGDGDSLGDSGLGGLFSPDIDTSGDSISTFFSILNTPISYLLILGIAFIAIIMIILIFTLLGKLLR